MASIDYYINDVGYDFSVKASASGLGFFGSGGFGKSVMVGAYQDTTYVTDGNGAVQGCQSKNVKYVHPNSGEVAGDTVLNLQYIPNYQATLNIRFTHDTAVRVDNAELRIYDRSSINNAASGVTTKVAEIIHTSVSQVVQGSGDTAFYTPAGSAVVVPMADSPGMSGLYAGDGVSSTYQDTRHDWYVAISQSPDSIGSKTLNSLWFSVEYL